MVTVLVVDDEPDLLTMVCAIMADEAPEAHVLVAPNGRAGLLRRRSTAGPLLILSDQHMPLLQGHQAFLCLQGRRRTDERWVVLSSEVTAGQRAMLKAAGVDEVVHKPVLWDDMVDLVRRLLHEWRPGPLASPFYGGTSPRSCQPP